MRKLRYITLVGITAVIGLGGCDHSRQLERLADAAEVRNTLHRQALMKMPPHALNSIEPYAGENLRTPTDDI